jgi:hypothetical protein
LAPAVGFSLSPYRIVWRLALPSIGNVPVSQPL